MKSYERKTVGLQQAAANRYALAYMMRDKWLETGDKWWLDCYEHDMLVAASCARAARIRMGVDSM